MVPQSDSKHPFDVFPWTQNFESPWSTNRIAQFQKSIDKIAGLALNGCSNVRLIWPSSSDESISMHVVQGEKRARYRLWTDVYQCTRTDPKSGLEIVEDVSVDLCAPRFLLEEYHTVEEEQFNPSIEGQTGRGYYTHLFTVAHHTEKCCGGTEARKGQLCFGLYHEPNHSTIEELQRRIRLRDSELHGHRAGERVSDGERADDLQYLRDWKEGWGQHLRSKYQEAIMDSLKTHGWRLYDHDGGKRSKYHFVNQGES